VMAPFKCWKISQITDGTSKTIMIGEQSGFCFDTNGEKRDCRSDFGHAFCMGVAWTDDRFFNATTVRYRINDTAWNQVGVGTEYYGANRPIQSAHPTGAFVLFADGSVRFIHETISLLALYSIANRDDGKSLTED